MTTLFFDTSALLKRYIDETGSERVRALIQTSPGPMFISAITRIGMACAFARRELEGSFSSTTRDRLWEAFRFDSVHHFRFIRVGIETLAAAEQLAFRYSLRAYDAVQLASAQFAIRRLRKIGRQGVIFLSADARLLGFAKSEGFTILNPLE
mgnify:FL=1